MAGSLNRVTLIGNVGQDPEIRSMTSGDRVANLSIATSETWKDKNTGEKKEHTDWHKVVVWGDGLVGVIERFVSKGSKVMVEGSLKTRKYQDRDGSDRYATEVVLKPFNGQLILLSGKNEGGERSSGGYDRGSSSGGGQTQQRQSPPADLDDEIPF